MAEKIAKSFAQSFGSATGELARLPFRPIGFAARKLGLGKGLVNLGRAATVGTGKAVATAAGKAPVETAIAVGSLGLAPSLLGAGGKKGTPPARQQAANAMQQQAQHFQTRTASVISHDDLQTHLAIRKQLEKTAMPRPRGPRLTRVQRLMRQVPDPPRGGGSGGRAAGSGAGRQASNAATDAAGQTQRSTKPKNKRKFSLFGKREGAPDYRQYLLAGLALGTAATAAGMGGQIASSGAGKIGEMTHRLGQTRHYNAMVKADPGLKQYDQAEIRKAFNVVHRASPYVAKEPLVAASTVRSIVDAPRADYGSKTPNVSLDAMRRVMDVEGARQGTRYPMFQEVKDSRPANMSGATDLLG